MSHTISSVFPAHHPHFTIQNAKHLDVKYTMRVRAVIEVPKEAKAKKGTAQAKDEPIKEVVLENVPVIVSPWSKKQGEYWITKIGQTPRNLQSPLGTAAHQPKADAQAIPNAPAGAPVNSSEENRSREHIALQQNSPTAGIAAKAFSQRVQQGNMASASTTSLASRNTQPQAPIPPRPIVPPPAPPEVEPPATRRSVEEDRAAAIERGRRLSSWPSSWPVQAGAAPDISVSSPTGTLPLARSSASNINKHSNAMLASPAPSRETQSDLGHRRLSWQPSREVASLDGHAVTLRDSMYPTTDRRPYSTVGPNSDMSRSYSQPQNMAGIGLGGPQTVATHRRILSEGQHPQYNPRNEDTVHENNAENAYNNRKASLSAQTNSISLANGQRQPSLDRNSQQPSQHYTHGFPTRRGTLSTIQGSLASSEPSSPTSEGANAPKTTDAVPQRNWASAEQEKQRLYDEAVDRARRTQEAAGNPVSQYRSVENRTPTPLNLMRSLSNPTPSRQNSSDSRSIDGLVAPRLVDPNNRHSMASTHLGYLNSQSADGHAMHEGGLLTPVQSDYVPRATSVGTYSPAVEANSSTSALGDHNSYQVYENRQSQLYDNRQNSILRSSTLSSHHLNASQGSNIDHVRSPTSALSQGSGLPSLSSIDPQKLAYLKALAAREAYQKRLSGQEIEPLTALEEKQRLQRIYEEEEGKDRGEEEAWSPLAPPAQHTLNGSRSRDSGLNADTSYTPSVYLTPNTSAGHRFQSNGTSDHNPYFATPYASSATLPSESSSGSAHNWQRNPEISKGKQRRTSMYSGENGNQDYEALDDHHHSGFQDLPPRPPKDKAIVSDSYRHLDTPVSPGAAEYERRLLFARSSQSSHYGH